MGRSFLGAGATRVIEAEIDKVFDRVKTRYLGISAANLQGKQIYISHSTDQTLPALYRDAARQEYTHPDLNQQEQLLRLASGYLETARAKAKSQIIAEITNFIRDADMRGIETDVKTALGGKLADLFGTVRSEVRKIVETESTRVRNLGALEGILKVSASQGIEDPVIFFAVLRDNTTCEECIRLHFLEDKKTPRAWKLSEVGHGHHKRGDSNPKIDGLHPFCRCSPIAILPGYGFKKGSLAYIAKEWDEWAHQRGVEPESDDGSAL
jgi:hypothetical protein